ncbi:MAG TPA: hypothetical protein DF364_03660 [Ruminococcaceae bacterium]|nr:hypothetical protein [Oscillospiraceae bacterium]
MPFCRRSYAPAAKKRSGHLRAQTAEIYMRKGVPARREKSALYDRKKPPEKQALMPKIHPGNTRTDGQQDYEKISVKITRF